MTELGIPLIPVNDPSVNENFDRIEDRFLNLARVIPQDAYVLSASLASGSDTDVSHVLGRLPTGIIPINRLGDGTGNPYIVGSTLRTLTMRATIPGTYSFVVI